MKLLDTIQSPSLVPIAEKVQAGLPVNGAEALTLLTTDDILALGAIAHFIRQKRHHRKTYYGVNMNLNYTNICELKCPICAFHRDAEDQEAYLYSLSEIEEKVRHAVSFGIDEVHIVGGLHPDLTIDYFEAILKTIKRIHKNLYIVAFTAVEYDYFSQKSGLTVSQVLDRFIQAGLDALPGGGAEIFKPEIREKLAPKKISGQKWLDIMRLAHQKGLKTNATLLYNHIEKKEDIVDHMLKIRDLQDETQGFKTFVPLPFHWENTKLKGGNRQSTGFDDIRLFATARIVLSNIPHLKGLWMYLGEKMAQVLLNFGVDDIGATYHYEKVVHAAGATTKDYGTETFLKRLITNAGMTPVRTTAGYGESGQ